MIFGLGEGDYSSPFLVFPVPALSFDLLWSRPQVLIPGLLPAQLCTFPTHLTMSILTQGFLELPWKTPTNVKVSECYFPHFRLGILTPAPRILVWISDDEHRL